MANKLVSCQPFHYLGGPILQYTHPVNSTHLYTTNVNSTANNEIPVFYSRLAEYIHIQINYISGSFLYSSYNMFSNCMYLEYTLKKPRVAEVFKKCCNVCQIIFIARTCVHVRYIYMYVYRPIIGCIHFSINWQMQYCSAFSQITF